MDSLAELLSRPTLSWRDVLDIALVSFLIYELLLLIRGTRAVQMALSGGFLIGLFFSRVAAARNSELADPQSGRLRRRCDHRAVPVGHSSRPRALRAGAVFRYFERATARTKRSRSW